MESEDSSLVVERSEVVLVKPSKPTPVVSLSLSTIDNHPGFESIVKTICVFVPEPQDEANHDVASLLQNALSNVLVYYYPLAGKLHRKSDDNRLQLNCKGGDGVPFIRATTKCTLSSLKILDNDVDAGYQLVPCYEPLKGCEEYDPLALQITKFSCGGITIGMSHSHSVCDGVGITQFFRAMMELASGKTQPTIFPVWDRERLTSKIINDELGDDNLNSEVVDLPNAFSSNANSPYANDEDMVREILNITSEEITRLKKIVAEEEQMTNKNEAKVVVTTLEILAAHVWRSRCRALKLSPDGTTVLGITIGIRSIMEPPLPEGYYGNALINGSVTLTSKELSESLLSRIVKLIQDIKRTALNKHCLSEELKVIERMLEEKISVERRIDIGSMILTDWRQIGLHYNGWGNLVNIIPLVPMKIPFLCILLPASKASPGMNGGVQLLVTLPKVAMAKFKEEMKGFSK